MDNLKGSNQANSINSAYIIIYNLHISVKSNNNSSNTNNSTQSNCIPYRLSKHCLCWATGSSGWQKWRPHSHDTHLCVQPLRPLSPDFSHSFPVSNLDECLLCFRLWREAACCISQLIGHVVINDLAGWQCQIPYCCSGQKDGRRTRTHAITDTRLFCFGHTI